MDRFVYWNWYSVEWRAQLSKTILIHSFREGVGRSNIAANMSFLLAAHGQRVGIVDTDTKSPTIDSLFGIKIDELNYSFNDYLQGKCEIEQAAHDITASLNTSLTGQLFLIPANIRVGEPVRVLNDTQDVHLLNTGCKRLTDILQLDALVIDTQSGVNKEALVSITISDILVIILRLDQRDYQGTSVTVDVVRQLSIPRVVLMVNEAPESFDFDQVKERIEQAYNCEVAAIFPHVDEMMALANSDIFALRHPYHPLTTLLKEAVANLMA